MNQAGWVIFQFLYQVVVIYELDTKINIFYSDNLIFFVKCIPG